MILFMYGFDRGMLGSGSFSEFTYPTHTKIEFGIAHVVPCCTFNWREKDRLLSSTEFALTVTPFMKQTLIQICFLVFLSLDGSRNFA